MEGRKFNISGPNLRVLVAPLDWGLGHATRCIPLIRELVKQNREVLIGADGPIKSLLQKEFPLLTFLPLPGYQIRYSRSKIWMPLKMMMQAPSIFSRIYSERRWVKKIIQEHNISLVISDNRFGLSNTEVPCMYITHQLNIKTGNQFTNWLARKFHYHYINKFTECWVPDIKEIDGFAGELSHPAQLPKTPVHYIGALSRFEFSVLEKKYDLAIILSGPEPQRTILEEQMLKELQHFRGYSLLVRGLPGDDSNLGTSSSSLEIHNALSSVELNKAILQSAIIICRSGYSSVMDLVALQKKAILIPTPGQTEQEYLAKYLAAKNIFYCVGQSDFSLEKDIEAAKGFSFSYPEGKMEEYKTAIKRIAGN